MQMFQSCMLRWSLKIQQLLLKKKKKISAVIQSKLFQQTGNEFRSMCALSFSWFVILIQRQPLFCNIRHEQINLYHINAACRTAPQYRTRRKGTYSAVSNTSVLVIKPFPVEPHGQPFQIKAALVKYCAALRFYLCSFKCLGELSGLDNASNAAEKQP